MKKIISLCIILITFLSSVCLGMDVYGNPKGERYNSDISTAINVGYADYLASQKIIKYWYNIDNYRFDDTIVRSEIMGMALAMAGITRNTTCRGDFADVTLSQIDWVCRTIETAADHGFINAQLDKNKSQRKARPYDAITRSEALAILMKGGDISIQSYDGAPFPFTDVPTNSWQYRVIGTAFQGKIIPEPICDTSRSARACPGISYGSFYPNRDALRREVFEVAYNISKASSGNTNNVVWKKYTNSDLKISFEIPADAQKTLSLNDGQNLLVVFSYDGDSWDFRIDPNEFDISKKEYFFLDVPGFQSDIEIGGKKTYQYSFPQGYCDGPGCSTPFLGFAFNDKKQKIYRVQFIGDTSLSPVEKHVLESIQFLD